MKFPKEMILTLKGGNKLHIELADVQYVIDGYTLKATIFISDDLVKSSLMKGKLNKKLIEFVMEEK